MSAERPGEQEAMDAQLSKLYRESGALEPPADIDQAILAAARREVHAGPRRVGHWLHQWRVPVSIAATIVVSATLVMVVVEEGGDRLEESAPVALAPARRELPAPPTAPTEDQTPRSPAAAKRDDGAVRRGDAPSQPSKDAESDKVTARQALTSPPKREPAPDTRALAQSPRAQPAPPPVTLARPFPAAPLASEAAPRAEVEDRVAPRPEPAAPRATEIPSRDAPGADTAGDLQARRERTDDAGTATLAPSRPGLGVRGFTDAPQPGEGRNQQRGRVAPPRDAIGRAAPSDPQKTMGPDTYDQERRDPASAAAIPAPAAKRLPPTGRAAPKPRPESRGAVLARDLADQPPEKWLERVEQLRREDRRSDADQLMVEFRRRFPEHPAAQSTP